MLDSLLSGRALAAGELARVAGVAASTASAHLAGLLAGGLVEVVAQGRHRYYRIAGPEVATALESLSHVAPPRPVRTLRESGHARALGFARTCYDHLAGRCGVALHDALLERGWLSTAYDVTPVGASALAGWGVDVDGARVRRRSFARPCLDWTERRPHLAVRSRRRSATRCSPASGSCAVPATLGRYGSPTRAGTPWSSSAATSASARLTHTDTCLALSLVNALRSQSATGRAGAARRGEPSGRARPARRSGTARWSGCRSSRPSSCSGATTSAGWPRRTRRPRRGRRCGRTPRTARPAAAGAGSAPRSRPRSSRRARGVRRRSRTPRPARPGS